MGRLAAILGGLLGLLLIPLALSRPTAILLLPGHLALSVGVCAAASLDGLAGRPERARQWGFFYLLITIGVVVALQVGANLRSQDIGYWGLPWAGVLLWGWIPPVVAGSAGVVGGARERRLVRRTVRRRKAAGRATEAAGQNIEI